MRQIRPAAIIDRSRDQDFMREALALAAQGAALGEVPVGAVLVQGVRSRVTISVDAVKPAARRSELVFIGYHTSRSNVAAVLSNLTGTQWR